MVSTIFAAWGINSIEVEFAIAIVAATPFAFVLFDKRFKEREDQ